VAELAAELGVVASLEYLSGFEGDEQKEVLLHRVLADPPLTSTAAAITKSHQENEPAAAAAVVERRVSGSGSTSPEDPPLPT
jgi:hypothetical protein